MPASVAPADKSTPALLNVLFWVGVGLAPLAALILLVADGNGSLRFGAVLAILAVVLIGLSIALRPDNVSAGAEAEELREELAQLRRELRAEIVAAAQRGNQALDQARRAEEVAGALRHRLDAAAAGLASAPVSTSASASAPAPERPSGAARVPVTGTSDVGRAQPAGRDDDEPARPAYSGGRYGTDADASRAGHYDADPPRTGHHDAAPSRTGRYDADSPRAGRYDAEPARAGHYDADSPRAGRHDAEPARATARPDRQASGVYGAARVSEPMPRPESRPVGVVHHTETVHVTTRHTIVGGGEPAGSRYGGFPGGWSDEDRSRGTDPADQWRAGHRESGRDDRTGRRAGPDDGGWGTGAGDDGHSWTDPGRLGAEHPWAGVGRATAGEQGWSGRTAGGGWSSGHDQGRTAAEEQRQWSGAGEDRAGRAASTWPAAGEPADRAGAGGDQWSEMRAGNRWAAVRDDGDGREIRLGERRAAVHADGGGTEYRVEDRWASVRGGRPDASGPDGTDDRWSGERESHPALPAGGVPVPDEWRPPTQRSGQPEWRQPPPEWHRPEPEWSQPAPDRHQAEPEWRTHQVEPDWRQPEARQPEPEQWRRPEPEWRPAEPEWRSPEHGAHGRPYRDTADRWR
ncbi:hypothetical protein [Micromonospora sp. WMMA1976]|uniref:hypothetical protein n=1 Tax=Micromonospora sp. WMMA1976 TaxID=3014995 RepID=UPI00248B7AA3|nr:hypothetical protein [Micromonospora sp. WMMA1976]WBC02744.1 hypothetical protein O7546_27105 [Micromonospora sp. WMMA1976]